MDYRKLKKNEILQELISRDTELSDKSEEFGSLKKEFEDLNGMFLECTNDLEQAKEELKSLREDLSTVNSDLDIITEVELRESQFIKVLCTALGLETLIIVVMLLAIIFG